MPGLDDRDASDPVVHAIREEMAQTLLDVVIRRTGLGAAGYPGDAVATDVAGRMQTAARMVRRTEIDSEIEASEGFYEVLK